MWPSKLSKMYKGVSGKCWKCKDQEGTFYHLWWTCKKAKTFWKRIHSIVQKILKTTIELKPGTFLLGLMDKNVKDKGGSLFSYMITAARLLYAQKWKNETIPMVNEWITKVMELAEMAKLTTIIKEG